MKSRLLSLALAALAAGALTACSKSDSTVAVTGVSVKATTSLLVGGTEQLAAVVTPSNATNAAVDWASSSTTVATVSAGGRVTAISPGTANVTVTTRDGGYRATCVVTVSPVPVAVSGVSIDPSMVLTAGTPGTSGALTAVISPADATNQNVTWTTDDASVASLSSTTGSSVVVTAHAQGTAHVTVTTADGAHTSQCTVTVNPATVHVTTVALDHATLPLLRGAPGTTGTLTVTITPADATNQDVTWTTSDASVAALSSTTGGTVTVTAGSAGIATITATTQDGAHTAQCVVAVALVDQTIPADVAATYLHETSAGSGQYDTKPGGAGSYVEIPVGSLAFYSEANGFKPGDADGGIMFNWYASGSPSAAAFGPAAQAMKSYVGIPAAGIATAASSVKVIVTAKSYPGMPGSRLALVRHGAVSSGKLIAVSDQLTETATQYTFDGVPANAQVDIFDGGPDGSYMYVEEVRVEPSAAAARDLTAPAEVTNLAAATDAVLTTQVALSWANPADGDFDHVEISYAGLATPISVSGTSYTVTGLTAGTAYTFAVRTVDHGGNQSAGVTANATPGVVPVLLDVSIAAGTAATYLHETSAGSGQYDTKPGGAGDYVEIPVGSLVFFSDANGFKPGDGDGGIMFNWYASGSGSDVTVGATGQRMKSYIGIPAASIATSRSTVTVKVTAKCYTGMVGARIALAQHGSLVSSVATGTVLGLSATLVSTPVEYTFTNVPANVQLDIFDGGPDGSYMYVESIRVE